MKDRKRIVYLKRAIKQTTKVLLVLRYRYFWDDDAKWEKFRKSVIEPLAHQLKMLQEELDTLTLGK